MPPRYSSLLAVMVLAFVLIRSERSIFLGTKVGRRYTSYCEEDEAVHTALAQEKFERRTPGGEVDNVFVLGYYHSGTNWLACLVDQNTPAGSLYEFSGNKHKYLSDNNMVVEGAGKVS